MMQKILKGDTSGQIALALADGSDYSNATVEVRYQSAVRYFKNCTAGQTIQFALTAEETSPMALGAFPVLVRIGKPGGQMITVTNASVKIEVTDCVADVRAGSVIAVDAHAGLFGVNNLPANYTIKDLRAKINEIIGKLGGGVAALCLLACTAFGAGVTAHKANLEDIGNASGVVTNVTFDASGLATSTDVQQAEARAVSAVNTASNNVLTAAKAHTDTAVADKITSATATQIAQGAVASGVADWAKAGQAQPVTSEQDPTVPAWAKAENPPATGVTDVKVDGVSVVDGGVANVTGKQDALTIPGVDWEIDGGILTNEDSRLGWVRIRSVSKVSESSYSVSYHKMTPTDNNYASGTITCPMVGERIYVDISDYDAALRKHKHTTFYLKRSTIAISADVDTAPSSTSTNRLVTSKGVADALTPLTAHAASTANPHGVTAAQVGAASSSELTTLAGTVATASAKADQANLYSSGVYQYMIGNTNAWMEGTNYVFGADAANRTRFAWEDGMNAGTVPCSMALWEIRNGQRQVVCDQRDWVVWYWNFKSAQLSNNLARVIGTVADEVSTNCMKRGWAKYTAVRGLDNPDPSALVVDTPKVQLFAGHQWEKLVETGGAGYWTLTGNGIELSAADTTNTFLTVKDFEGNACLTFRKTSSYLVYCETGTDITSNYMDGQGRVVFHITTDVQPTAEFSTTLDLEDFVEQGESGCPANYEWTGSAGNWDCHFLLKPGIVSNTCFARFKVMRQGENVVEHTIPIKINGGIVFDHNGQSVKIRPTVTSTAVGSAVNWVVAQ